MSAPSAVPGVSPVRQGLALMVAVPVGLIGVAALGGLVATWCGVAVIRALVGVPEKTGNLWEEQEDAARERHGGCHDDA